MAPGALMVIVASALLGAALALALAVVAAVAALVQLLPARVPGNTARRRDSQRATVPGRDAAERT